MNEEVGNHTALIRWLKDKMYCPYVPKDRRSDPQKSDVIDKYCNLCGGHGHGPSTWAFTAKLIIASESIHKVDTKTKKEIQDAFKQAQRKKRERRLKRHTSMIRQLLDNGGTKEDIEAVLNIMQQDNKDEQLDNFSADDADRSTTSTSEWQMGQLQSKCTWHLSWSHHQSSHKSLNRWQLTSLKHTPA